jgi:hypothetical protein
MSHSPTLAAPLPRPDQTAAAFGLDALLDWGDGSTVAPPPTFTSAPDVLAAHVSRVAGLAAESPSAATRDRSALVAAAWATHAGRRGWEWAHRPDALAVGVDATTTPPTPAIRRWAVVSAEEAPSTVLALRRPGAGGLVWQESVVSPGLPHRALIGLAGLALLDLTELPNRHAIALAADDVPAAARALADVLDGAVDLGLAIGFVRRVADYLSDRFLADGEPASEVEPAVLQQLGAAYAELSVVSEGLREAVLAAAGDPEVWSRTAAGHRRDTAPQLADLLSDLFEAAGASATSSRYALDRPWRDFTVRQALFPPAGDARKEER